MDATVVDGPLSNAVDCARSYNGSRNVELLAKRNNGSVSLAVEVRAVEGGDLFDICDIVVDPRRQVPEPSGDIMEDSCARDVNVMPFFPL